MEDTLFLTVIQNVFILILLLATPILGVSMIVGLMISVFQSVTQIQEATLTFVPKIIISILALIILMPWMVNIFITRTHELYSYINVIIAPQ